MHPLSIQVHRQNQRSGAKSTTIYPKNPSHSFLQLSRPARRKRSRVRSLRLKLAPRQQIDNQVHPLIQHSIQHRFQRSANTYPKTMTDSRPILMLMMMDSNSPGPAIAPKRKRTYLKIHSETSHQLKVMLK